MDGATSIDEVFTGRVVSASCLDAAVLTVTSSRSVTDPISSSVRCDEHSSSGYLCDPCVCEQMDTWED
jgi:hypothetical protein